MPRDADLPLHAAFEPGTPFADEVEDLLAQDAPVDVNPADVDAVVDALVAKHGPLAPEPSRRVGWVALVAAVVLVAWLAWPAETPTPVPTVRPASTAPGLLLSAAAQATTDGHTLSLIEGEVVFTRDGTVTPPVSDVRLTRLDLVVVPVGTVFAAGARGTLGAVVVQDGEVQIRHDDVEVARVRAGDGVVVWRSGEGIVALPGTALPPSVDEEGRRLLASLRWSMLPERTREALGPPR